MMQIFRIHTTNTHTLTRDHAKTRSTHSIRIYVVEWETNNYPYRHLTTHGTRSANARMNVNVAFFGNDENEKQRYIIFFLH